MEYVITLDDILDLVPLPTDVLNLMLNYLVQMRDVIYSLLPSPNKYCGLSHNDLAKLFLIISNIYNDTEMSNWIRMSISVDGDYHIWYSIFSSHCHLNCICIGKETDCGYCTAMNHKPPFNNKFITDYAPLYYDILKLKKLYNICEDKYQELKSHSYSSLEWQEYYKLSQKLHIICSSITI